MVKITLENDCTIYEVSEKHHQIVDKWPQSGEELQFDLSGVGEMDVCFIQMLMSCEQSARNQELSFKLLNVPDELMGKFNRLAAVNLLESIPENAQA